MSVPIILMVIGVLFIAGAGVNTLTSQINFASNRLTFLLLIGGVSFIGLSIVAQEKTLSSFFLFCYIPMAIGWIGMLYISYSLNVKLRRWLQEHLKKGKSK